MAEGKKSFLLYCDLIHMVKKLPKEKQAELFIHILEYVNDMNPITEDVLLQIAFEPIKQGLKRDLVKYEKIVNRNRENGQKGGRPPKPKKPNGLNQNPSKPKKADSDSDSDNVNDNVNDILLEKETKGLFKEWLEYRKEIKKTVKSQKTLISLARKIQLEGYQKSNIVIQESITNGWTGLFWDKNQNQKEKTSAKKEKVSASDIIMKRHGLSKTQ